MDYVLNHSLIDYLLLTLFQIESLKQELAKKDVMVTEHIRAVSELSKSSQTQISQLEEVIATKAKECERLQKNVQFNSNSS